MIVYLHGLPIYAISVIDYFVNCNRHIELVY